MQRTTLRSHYWGPVLMVVVGGAMDADGARTVEAHLRHAQGEGDVIVDLWDVTRFDRAAVGVLTDAKRRTEDAGWGFALVADPSGPCRDAIEAAGETGFLRPVATRQQARAALQRT